MKSLLLAEHSTRSVRVASVLACAAMAVACAAEQDDSVYVEKPMALTSISEFGAPAVFEMRHGASGCVESIGFTIESEAAAGSSTSGKDQTTEVAFAPRTGFGMALAKLKITDADGTWELQGGDGWLPLDALDPGYDAVATTADEALKTPGIPVNKLLIWPRGTAKLTRTSGGDAAEKDFDLSQIQFGGDVTSAVDGNATCSLCQTDDCQAPFPTWRLRDFQRESARFNLRYDMNAMLGKVLVTIITQGW